MRTYPLVLALCFVVAGIGCEKNNSGGADTPAERAEDEAQTPATPEETPDHAENEAHEGAAEAEPMGEAADQAQQTMQTYLDRVGELTASVADVDGGLGALAGAPEIKDHVDQVHAVIDQLRALAPDLLTDLRTRFAPQIKTVNDALKAQLARIADIPQLSGIKKMLESLNLIEPG